MASHALGAVLSVPKEPWNRLLVDAKDLPEGGAMQEDILGTQRAALPITYVQCAQCGEMTPRQTAHLISSDMLSDSHSEYEYLCADCHAALIQGELELPSDTL